MYCNRLKNPKVYFTFENNISKTAEKVFKIFERKIKTCNQSYKTCEKAVKFIKSVLISKEDALLRIYTPLIPRNGKDRLHF